MSIHLLPPVRLRTSTMAAISICGAVAGISCTGGLNQFDGLRGVPEGSLPDLGGGAAVANDAPSARTAAPNALDRRHWPVVVVEVPARQVEHQPTCFEPVMLARGPARLRGEPPTAGTALEGASDGGSLLAEAAAAPVIWAGELIIAPLRIFVQPPWTTVASPAPTMQRALDACADWRWVEPSR